MKKINIFLAAIAFLFVNNTAFANNNESGNPISNEIGRLLEKPSLEIEESMDAVVTFIFNENQEIVVLSVDTNDSSIETYIKSRLNYKKLKSSGKSVNGKYVVNVKIQKNVI